MTQTKWEQQYTNVKKNTETNLAHGKAKWPSEKPKHQNKA